MIYTEEELTNLKRLLCSKDLDTFLTAMTILNGTSIAERQALLPEVLFGLHWHKSAVPWDSIHDYTEGLAPEVRKVCFRADSMRRYNGVRIIINGLVASLKELPYFDIRRFFKLTFEHTQQYGLLYLLLFETRQEAYALLDKYFPQGHLDLDSSYLVWGRFPAVLYEYPHIHSLSLHIRSRAFEEHAEEEIWPDFSRLTTLRTLNLSHHGNFGILPESLWASPKLEQFSLSSESIKALPSSIGKLKTLRYLHLSSCEHLETLPESLWTLPQLEQLWLSSTSIKALPSSIGKLKTLRYLNISSCEQLTSIPPTFQTLALKSFRAVRTAFPMDTLKNLFQQLGTMTTLESLNVDTQTLQTLPEHWTQLTKLRYLTLVGEALEDFPPQILHYKQLEILSISFQQPITLPSTLVHLPKLELLGLGSTTLTAFPFFLQKMPKLKRLDISNIQVVNLSKAQVAACIQQLQQQAPHLIIQ